MKTNGKKDKLTKVCEIAHRNIGQNQTAIEYYEKAKQITLKHGDKRIERQAFRGLGNAYLNVGKYQTAIEYFEEAQNITL